MQLQTRIAAKSISYASTRARSILACADGGTITKLVFNSRVGFLFVNVLERNGLPDQTDTHTNAASVLSHPLIDTIATATISYDAREVQLRCTINPTP